jgi:hypothetical protein
VVLGGVLGPFAFTFVATWLFNHSGGSVLMTLVMHATEGSFTHRRSGLRGRYRCRQACSILWCDAPW